MQRAIVRRAALAAAGSWALAASALAGGTLSSGDASLQMVGLPVFSSGLGDINVVFTPAPPTGAGWDTMYKLTWYYRTPANNADRVMSSLDTPVETFAGDHARIVYTNAGPMPRGFERFNAALDVWLTDGSQPNQGVVEQRMVFQADTLNTGTVTYQFFLLLDADLGGTIGDDTASVADASLVRLRQTDGSGPASFDSYGIGATRYEVNSGWNLRQKLNAGIANDLNKLAFPVSGDAAVAYQWSLTLTPGESRVINVKFALSAPACRADFTSDGARTPADIFAFLSAYFAGDARGDFTLDNARTPADIFGFLSAYFAGC
jgi:hypothetical protein